MLFRLSDNIQSEKEFCIEIEYLSLCIEIEYLSWLISGAKVSICVCSVWVVWKLYFVHM